ncbi:MAG TPA: hypothetical protein VGM52_04570 [Herbaspirillum sp.]
MKIHIVAALLLCISLHGIAAVVISPSVLPGTPAGDAPEKAGPLRIALTVKKIVLQHGKERLVDAKNAVPGDVLEYRAEYKNTGATALTEILATLPLPAQTTFIMGSAYPDGAAVSKKNTRDVFAPLPQKIIAGNSTIASSPDAYAALRWAIEKLEPGQMSVFGMRVRVDGSTEKGTPSVSAN